MLRYTFMLALLVGCLDERTTPSERIAIDPVEILDVSAEVSPTCEIDPEPNECCALADIATAHMCVAAQASEGTCISVRCVNACEVTRLHGCNL